MAVRRGSADTSLFIARESGGPVDEPVARAWARLRVELRDAGRRLPVNASWIAATAIALEVPVVTQDDDYAGVPSLEVIRI